MLTTWIVGFIFLQLLANKKYETMVMAFSSVYYVCVNPFIRMCVYVYMHIQYILAPGGHTGLGLDITRLTHHRSPGDSVQPFSCPIYLL